MLATNNIGYLLQHLAFTMARQNDQLLQEQIGLGFSQFKILMVLQRNPSTQQRDIAESLGQTEASISRQIKLMHDMGLLQTRISPENRRKHLTTLTLKGERLSEEALRILNKYHGPMFAKLSDRDQERLLETLSHMHTSVCQSGKTAACARPFNT